MGDRHLVAALRNNVGILRGLVGAMSPEAVERRIKDYWTVLEHLEHLVLTQAMLLGRMEQFLAEERPTMKPYTPGEASPATKGAAVLLDEFAALRERQAALVEKAPEATWKKRGEHPEYREYGFEILVRHTVLHDSYHMCRMEDLWIMKPENIRELA
jgi:hypothetical protein